MSGREYRVKWKRVEWPPKTKRFAGRKAAERLVFMMTAHEPWRAWAPEKGPDDFACCDGRECGCVGQTVRQESDAKREAMPPLEYVRIEWRPVGAWATDEEIAVPEP